MVWNQWRCFARQDEQPEYNHVIPMTHQTELLHTFRKAAVVVGLMFCFSFGLHSTAQAQALPSQGQRTPAEIEWEAQQKRAAEKALNEKRQQDLKKDTDKLLQLATELKQYVDKTNEHTLSVEVIKKADEIEKLAHTVREKMKGPY
jgi:flagellar motility protein MotE (MotC chaperone)